MRKIIVTLMSSVCFFVVGIGTAIADSHESDEPLFDPATPIEIYACKYNEGYGMSDIEVATAKWNDWADDRGMTDYSAWILTAFYYGADQDFDFLWAGGSSSGQALGATQDDWIANGGKIAEAFDEASTCDAHGSFASLEIKSPPEREDAENLMVSFSDCNLSDGTNFSDIAPSLKAWGEYREGHGSGAGMWVWFPVYGGGGEEFDFKFIAAYESLADQGADFDEYGRTGVAKARELFRGKVACDSSRVYVTRNVRRAESDDE